LLGTYWLLDPDEQALLKGFIVNKFRGDLSLFSDGVRILEERSGVRVLGVMPYLNDLYIPEEDSVALEALPPVRPDLQAEGVVDIAVVRTPRISNFDDFDPLAAEPGVRLRYVDSPEQLAGAAAVILPGSKSTVSDLAWLHSRGLDEAIRRHAASGGAVVGICGGYQMLGRAIHDPRGVESPQEHTPGLGLLPIETTFAAGKATHQASGRVTASHGWFAAVAGETIGGYEIHMGRTEGAEPWLHIDERSGAPVSVPDGASDPGGRVWGSYFHGLFANPKLCHAWLQSLGWQGEGEPITADSRFAASLTYLTDTLESVLDMDYLEKMIWEG
jgi:adenosylcobyric acid synthase